MLSLENLMFGIVKMNALPEVSSVFHEMPVAVAAMNFAYMVVFAKYRLIVPLTLKVPDPIAEGPRVPMPSLARRFLLTESVRL